MGATRAINVTQREARRRDARARHGGRLRRRARDVGQRRRRSATCCATMHHGGSVALLGIPPAETAIDWNQVIFKGLVIKGIYGREMFETWYKMAAMLQSGLDVSAGDHAPLADRRTSGKAFEIDGQRPVGQGDPGLGWPRSRRGSLDPAGTEVDRPALRRERKQRTGAIERWRRVAAARCDAARRHSRAGRRRRAGA